MGKLNEYIKKNGKNSAKDKEEFDSYLNQKRSGSTQNTDSYSDFDVTLAAAKAKKANETTQNTTARGNGLLQADRKQRIKDIVSQSGAALRNGALRPQGYAEYRREIDDLIKSGASGELVKAKKDEYTQFKTDQYNKKQARRKQLLLNKAEKDPDFAEMVKLGKNRFDTLSQEKDKKGFRVSFSPANGGNDLAEYTQRNYKLNTFNEDERNTYLYLLGKEGWKAADEYEKLIQRDVNARTAPKEYEFMRDFAKEHKAGAAALYPAMGFFQGAALGDTVRQGLRNAGKKDGEFVPADNNGAMYMAPRNRAAMMEGITDGMNEKQKFLTQTGLSALDFLTAAAVGGGLTSGLGMTQKAAQTVTLGLMGANAGGTRAYEAIEQGATPGQAAALGLTAAAAEIAFEKIPVGHFMQMSNGEITAALGKEILKQAAEEGLEELGTEYVNLLSDRLIMGSKAEMNQYMTELMAEGVKANDAKKAAIMEFAVKRPAMAFLGGAVSGAGIGAAGAGVGRINLMTNPVVNEMVQAVQESTGMSKAKAWGVVIQAMQGNDANAENIPENAENNPESAGMNQNIPALPESVEQNEEAQENNADWREDIISAVMDDNNMSYEDAEQAVDQAQNAIVPTAEQKENSRQARIYNALIEDVMNARGISRQAAEMFVNEARAGWQERQIRDRVNEIGSVPEEYDLLNEPVEKPRWTEANEEARRRAYQKAAIERDMAQAAAEAESSRNSIVTEQKEHTPETQDIPEWYLGTRNMYDRMQDAFRRGGADNTSRAYIESYAAKNPALIDVDLWEQTLRNEGKKIDERSYAQLWDNSSEQREQRRQYQNAKIEAYEQTKQQKSIENAVVRLAVNEISKEYSKYGGLKKSIEQWVRSDIAKNGIPETYKNNYREYIDDLISDLEWEVGELYSEAKGSTVEAKTRNALKTVLARDGRISFTAATESLMPEGVIPENEETETAIPEEQTPEKYTKTEDGEIIENETPANDYYGINPYKNRTDAQEVIKLAQDRMDAKRAFDNIIKKRKLSDGDMKVLRAVVQITKSVWDNGNYELAIDNAQETLRRFQKKNGTDIYKINDRDIITKAIAYTDLSNQLNKKSGRLRAEADERAWQYVHDDKVYEKAKDKNIGWLYSRETAERNNEDVLSEDVGAAGQINDTYFSPIHQSEALLNEFKNNLKESRKKLGIDTGKKKLFDVAFEIPRSKAVFKGQLNEDGIVQAYGENLINEETLESLTDNKGNKIDAEKIRHAVKWMSGEYKKLIDSVNLLLIEYGQEPIPERKNYFPHWTEDEYTGWKGIFQKLGVDLSEKSLPTSIAGLTEDFKPGRKWVGNFMQRTGPYTEYGALKGMQKYVDTVGEVLYHMNDIQNLRALSRAIRREYAPEFLREQQDDIWAEVYRGDREYESALNDISKLNKDVQNSKLPNYVNWLDEYTNLLAGKNSRLDRDMEQQFGRKAYSIFKSINDRATSNMVGGNVASAFTNFIPFTQANITVKNKLRGLYDTIHNAINNDGLMDDSVFYTNRKGYKPEFQTKLQTYAGKAGFLMEMIDRITAESLVRGRYYDNIEKGMGSQEAMADADNHAGRVMADRSKGALPIFVQTKNPALKMLTMFQTEVNNQYSYMFKDIPRANREKGMAMVAAQLAKVFFGAFVFNELYEKVIGRRPAFDPIDIATTAVDNFMGRERNNLLDVILKDADLYEDKEIGTYDAIAATAKDVAEEIPFIGGVLGGGRVPISDALPDIPAVVKNIIQAQEDPEKAEMSRYKIIKEAVKPAAYLVPPAGGMQAKKTIEGLLEASQGASYGYNAQGQKVLRYPVENDSTDDYIRNALFGRTASEGYQQWKRNGFNNLNANETQRYNEAVNAGISYDAFMGCKYDLKQYSKKAEKARAMYENKDLTTKQKDLMWDILTPYTGKDVPDFSMRRNEFYEVWKAGDEK